MIEQWRSGSAAASTPYAIALGIQGDQRVLSLADGRRFAFTNQPDGRFLNLTDAAMQGVVITESGGIPSLRWKDGAVWTFSTPQFPVLNIAPLAGMQDRNGNTITLTYDGSGRITKVTDPIGRTVQYAYNGNGNLATVTDPEGGTTRYSYDSSNRITTITDARNIVYLQNFYGPSGRVLRQIQADGSEYRFRYQLTGATSSGAGCTVVNPPTGTSLTSKRRGFVMANVSMDLSASGCLGTSIGTEHPVLFTLLTCGKHFVHGTALPLRIWRTDLCRYPVARRKTAPELPEAYPFEFAG